MTAYALGQSVTTQYTLDTAWSGYPLAAEADGQTTYYLYGRGPIAEKTTAWSYYLKDGQGTARQLADPSGLVTLARTFTPWGETLDQHGDGDLAWGYFGGYMDAATGLLYVGDGQYYDPSTGRFLTRQPGQINPYVPGGDPLGSSVGVLGLLGMLRKRKRNRKSNKLGMLIVLLAVLAGGASLAACGGVEDDTLGPSPIPPTQPPSDTVTPSPAPSVTPSLTPMPSPTGTAIPTLTCTLTSTPLPTMTSTLVPLLTLTPMPTPGGLATSDSKWIRSVERYERIRARFTEAVIVPSSGDPDFMFGPRFKDEYLIGFIIGGELATQVGAGTRAGYAALDAVYHQYRYVFCTPDCDSVWRQIVWLSTMEAWYSDANIDDWFIGQCNKSVLDGKPQEVIAGLHQGIGETWGNYMFNSPMYYSIHPDLRPEHYQGVDYEYVAYDEEYTDLGRGFIVMTNAQKRACGSCLGWTASTPTPEP